MLNSSEKLNYEHRAPPHDQKRLYRHNALDHAVSPHLPENAMRLNSSLTCSTLLIPEVVYTFLEAAENSMQVWFKWQRDAGVNGIVRADYPNRKAVSDKCGRT